MRNTLRQLLAVSVLAVTSVAQSADRPPYKPFDEGAAQPRDDFNAAKGTVRALFVVDPTCPGCLRGLDDVNKDVLSKTGDPRFQTFIVHVPVLTPVLTEEGVSETATLVPTTMSTTTGMRAAHLVGYSRGSRSEIRRRGCVRVGCVADLRSDAFGKAQARRSQNC